MNNINITLPDNSVKTFPEGITAQEVANSIGPGLARAVVVAKIDGVLKDLNYKILKDSSLELFTGDSPEGHDTLLHSTAHLMAQAVKTLYPNAKFTIGPTIENGFYYDFDLDVSFSEALDFIRKSNEKAINIYHHLGIYCYQTEILKKFVSFEQSHNEKKRSLEQIRALDNGIKINVALAKSSPIGIDTEEDFVAIKKIMEYKSQ